MVEAALLPHDRQSKPVQLAAEHSTTCQCPYARLYSIVGVRIRGRRKEMIHIQQLTFPLPL